MMDKAGPTWWNAAIERVIKARKGLLKKPVDNKARMALHPDTYRHLRRGSQRTLSDMKKRSRLSSTNRRPDTGRPEPTWSGHGRKCAERLFKVNIGTRFRS
jgi:hypothetical protein